MPIFIDDVDLDPGAGLGVPGTVLQRRYATLGNALLGGIDELGTKVYLEELKGWHDSNTTGTVEQHPTEHGGNPDPASLTPKVMSVKARLVGSSFLAVSRSLRLLARDLPINDLAEFIVDDHGDQMLARVRQSGDLQTDQKGAAGIASFGLVAPDPRRYSVDAVTDWTGLPRTTGGLSLPLSLPLSVGATVSSGRVAVENIGNIETRPLLEVRGPCPPWSITHIGARKRIRSTEPVAAGRSLFLDTDAKTAFLDGDENSRLIIGSWFDLEPGVNEIAFTAASYEPDARLFITHRSAWR